jgi:hypothetical protein
MVNKLKLSKVKVSCWDVRRLYYNTIARAAQRIAQRWVYRTFGGIC